LFFAVSLWSAAEQSTAAFVFSVFRVPREAGRKVRRERNKREKQKRWSKAPPHFRESGKTEKRPNQSGGAKHRRTPEQ
jgi:hypothetical protein